MECGYRVETVWVEKREAEIIRLDERGKWRDAQWFVQKNLGTAQASCNGVESFVLNTRWLAESLRRNDNGFMSTQQPVATHLLPDCCLKTINLVLKRNKARDSLYSRTLGMGRTEDRYYTKNRTSVYWWVLLCPPLLPTPVSKMYTVRVKAAFCSSCRRVEYYPLEKLNSSRERA